jgi:hypothetical protein
MQHVIKYVPNNTKQSYFSKEKAACMTIVKAMLVMLSAQSINDIPMVNTRHLPKNERTN